MDALTPAVIAAIDQGLIAEISSSRARKVARLISHFMEQSKSAVPGLPDYFYLLRIEHMLDAGVLVISRDAEFLMQSDVRLA